MTKSKKSDTARDEDAKPKAEVSDDVVDAEVIEEVAADEAAPDEAPATETPESDSSDSAADDAEDTPSDAPTEADSYDETPDAPAMSEETVAPAEQVPSSNTSMMPMVLGGAVAAALGFGAAYVFTSMPSEPDAAVVALQSEQADLVKSVAAMQAAQSESRAATTASQEAASSLYAAIEGLTGSMAALNGRIDDLAGALANFDARITELEKRPISQGLPSTAIEAYERELEDLKASVAAQRAEAEAMEENAKLTAQQALARAAMTRVLSALDAGQSFRVPLNDLVTATGEAAPAELDAIADRGVSSLAKLQEDYPAAARAALAAARQTEGTGGNRLLSFMQAQLGARSVTPQQGDDADAVLSRAEEALRRSNLTDALAELTALPDSAAAAMAGWVAQATARRDALAAGDVLSQALNRN